MKCRPSSGVNDFTSPVHQTSLGFSLRQRVLFCWNACLTVAVSFFAHWNLWWGLKDLPRFDGAGNSRKGKERYYPALTYDLAGLQYWISL